MTETHSEVFARLVLESWGMQVVRHATGPTRTADFLATDEEYTYIVEVTEKEPTTAFGILTQEADSSGFASMSRPLEYWNVQDAKIRNKHKQIRDTSRQRDSLTVLWYYAPRGEGRYHIAQLERTLLGVACLIDRKSDRPPINCYFYNHFAFFRTPELDAVIGGNENGLLMLVNPHSVRLALMRRSSIYRHLAGTNSVVDPEILEAKGSAIHLPVEVDRSQDAAKKKALLDLYGIDPVVMKEQQFSGLMSFPRDHVEQPNGPLPPPPAREE